MSTLNTAKANRVPPLLAQRGFSTERLQLAIFLHADGRLRFRNCERTGQSKVRFVFDDPMHMGDSLELEFENGARVSATSLFASQKYLRRQMSEALENRRTSYGSDC